MRGIIIIVGNAYSSLAGIVEAEEEQLSVLVCKPELGEHVPNYTMAYPSASFLLPVCCFTILSALDMRQPARCRCKRWRGPNKRTPVDDPHIVLFFLSEFSFRLGFSSQGGCKVVE
jgi:hypothetical protein